MAQDANGSYKAYRGRQPGRQAPKQQFKCRCRQIEEKRKRDAATNALKDVVKFGQNKVKRLLRQESTTWVLEKIDNKNDP